MKKMTITAIAVVILVAMPSTALASHLGTPDRDCSDFSTQQQAQTYYEAHGGPAQDPDRLDADGDGRACDSLPSGGTTAPAPAPAPTDADFDGVPDASDACPTAYAVRTDGCPDSDGDGIADKDDACPAQAGDGTQANGCKAPAPRLRYKGARIVSVTDGDTLKARLASGKRVTVRLLGIDTPETRKPGIAVECGGPQATANMKRLALRRGVGRRVTLVTDPTQDTRDRYGRLLAYAKVDSGRDLGLEQVRAGWSAAYVYRDPFERLAAYRAAEAGAKASDRGVWGVCGGTFHRPA